MYSLATDWPFDLASFLRYLLRWLVNNSLVWKKKVKERYKLFQTKKIHCFLSLLYILKMLYVSVHAMLYITMSTSSSDSPAMLTPCSILSVYAMLYNTMSKASSDSPAMLTPCSMWVYMLCYILPCLKLALTIPQCWLPVKMAVLSPAPCPVALVCCYWRWGSRGRGRRI
jgi:hypothetical protein